ncbi:hypothetical protein FISHEDRAFT_58297 [Fistulina hepatica ATCC 64428]|nr:hypothetical protein FISHEDRAFT_58297 [Fistulina hepatica ATCC 64428]
MRVALAFLASLVAFAYSVKWTMVSTDRSNFTILLVNQGASYSEVLANDVQGSADEDDVSAPSGGWVVGTGYRVNLVKDADDLDSILAQSDEFNITTAASGSASSATVSSTSTSTATSSSSSSSSTSSSNGASSLASTANLFALAAAAVGVVLA